RTRLWGEGACWPPGGTGPPPARSRRPRRPWARGLSLRVTPVVGHGRSDCGQSVLYLSQNRAASSAQSQRGSGGGSRSGGLSGSGHSDPGAAARYYDPDTTAPVSFYLSSLEELLSWAPGVDDGFNVALEPLAPRQPPLSSPRPRTLLCHDMMGGYLEDR
uniref:Uncharacterized protein n=1 Tax=Oryctolagus cuniculus TaxID=9986 RepID=A0A5F9CG59_RABIT